MRFREGDRGKAPALCIKIIEGEKISDYHVINILQYTIKNENTIS